MTSLRSFFVAATAIFASLAAATSAQAQEDTDTLPIERFRPTIDSNGLGTTEGGAIPSHLGWQTGLILNYALNPLVIRNPEGGIVAPIVAHRLGGDVLFTIGLFDYVSVGVDLPLLFVQTSGEIPEDLGNTLGVANGIATIGVGDLKLVPKVRLLREDRHFVSLSIIPALTLPTAGGFNLADGSYDYGGSFLGEGPGSVAFIPEVAVSTNIKGVRAAANLAYRLRQPTRFLGQLDINPEIVYRVGAGYDLSTLAPKMTSLLLFGEVFGATADRNPFGLVKDSTATPEQQTIDETERRLTNPLEWAAGVRYATPLPGLLVEGGFGSGLLPGYGSPDLRLFFGARYGMDDRDKDDDGIEDRDDKCPDDPEDKDGHEDSDGCPDPDNDGDGIPDSADSCPNDAEDADGFKDGDGCPDEDNDNDGIKDPDDQCPNEAGDPAFHGCPPPDRDGDTVPDPTDLCPDVAGKVELSGCPDRDGDGVEDDKDQCPDEPGPKESGGCPDKDGDKIIDKSDRCPDVAGLAEFQGCPDTDKDGIPDPDDKCPTEPETINGKDDTDGCPDKGEVVVIITKEKIELKRTVYFDTGKDTIQKRSFSLLDQVAQVLKAHPEIKKLMVEGHTDDQGPDDFNLDLSKRRAASVMKYLIDHGVAPERLVSEGYGESRPITENKTRRGREQNRRVEMRILEQE